jgi:hypothetical protein
MATPKSYLVKHDASGFEGIGTSAVLVRPGRERLVGSKLGHTLARLR